ncbi:hypothetical protein Droror1_Dr00000080 [Drosera rotundifolia]
MIRVGIERLGPRSRSVSGDLVMFSTLGTGLLSMMALRAMRSNDPTTRDNTKGMVTACESFLPMVKLMRKVLHHNAMEKKIHLINKRSDELIAGVDISSRADVLVSEILDSELLGEGLILTLQNAHDMLLVENPVTVPHRAVSIGQLVESEFLRRLHDLYTSERNVTDGIHLVPSGLENVICVKPCQHPMHCDPLEGEVKLLSEPFKIFEFDFWKRPESKGETDIVIKASKNGKVNAIISWWILQLDREGTIFYSTAPQWVNEAVTSISGDRNWCDHWKQCVWFIPGEGSSLAKNEEVHLHATHSEISISYDLKTKSLGSDNGSHNCWDKNFQLILSPERIALYGNSKWRSCMQSALHKAVLRKMSPFCVVVDDSIFLATLVGHLSSSSRIIALFPGLRVKGSKYIQAIAEANGFSAQSVEVVEEPKVWLITQAMHLRKVDLLVAEPFYYGHDSRLPWQNLRFWKERTLLDEILADDAQILPCKGLLRVCAMSLPDLWRSRCSLGTIEGFEHSAVNVILGACGNLQPPHDGPCMPFFIWQCGESMELSATYTIMEFDFTKPMSRCNGRSEIKFTEHGICNAFVLWIDWVLDSEDSIIVSTGPDSRYWKQGVKLVARPVTVRPLRARDVVKGCVSAEIEASFDSLTGNLDIRYAFLD